MESRPIKLFLIEDNPGDARLIQEMLGEIPHSRFVLDRADCLAAGIQRLTEREDVDIVLLDLTLPDSRGLDTFVRLQQAVPHFPVIVLTGLPDETVGMSAVQAGAQDYLLKGRVDGNLLARSIRYAIERQRMLKELKLLSVTDELTGLYNRRGFQTFGAELLKLGRRMGAHAFLIYTDLDKMKWINDNLGHPEGDRALREIGQLLRRTFRETDLVARIGGDEFAIMGILSQTCPINLLTDRLRLNLEELNAKREQSYRLSVSLGAVTMPIGAFMRVDELLRAADEMMYDQKRQKAE
jgi:two-component system cell cycle response regulator